MVVVVEMRVLSGGGRGTVRGRRSGIVVMVLVRGVLVGVSGGNALFYVTVMLAETLGGW